MGVLSANTLRMMSSHLGQQHFVLQIVAIPELHSQINLQLLIDESSIPNI